jgi:hypothetical protein|tara:strand:+ start:1723 stop:1986 length:264 start_codon:yes stop_codon:yes gene_type:complete
MIFKVLGNSVNLNSASNVGSATLVRIVNTTAAEKTITVANTVSKVNGGGTAGTFVLESLDTAFVAKKATDTVTSTDAGVKATSVSRT